MKQSYLLSLTVLGTAVAGLILGTSFGGGESRPGSEGKPLALASIMPDAQESGAAPAAEANSPAMMPMDRASIWLNEQLGKAAAPAEEAAIPPAQEPEAAAPQMAARAEPLMALLAQNAAPAEPAAAAPAPPAEPEEQPAAPENTAPASEATAGAAAPAEAAKTEDAAKAAEPAARAKTAETAPAPERGILNGYKGYRHHRPGYKSAGDGWWYPRAAFAAKPGIEQFMQTAAAAPLLPAEEKPAAASAASAKMGPAIRKTAPEKVRPRRVIRPRLSQAEALSRHMQWCAARHPSYNQRDNSYRETFEKHYCVSPYSRFIACRK